MKLSCCKAILSACLILLCVSAYSAIEGKPRKMQNIPAGTWGGSHIRIEVENDAARVEYDCANGTISGPLKVDRSGKFNWSGTHFKEHGGPVRIDEKPQGQPAQYSGWTDGKKMTLSVTLTKTNETLGTFTLVYGEPGQVQKCR